ncbi:hypothetical protein VZG28_05105 [Synechococcus elongatus IITB4]|uniref:hypothetical protein n=1 Tax=Synechococcus elongatus TaxID=32046 RepID=UPI0030D34221
MTQGRTGAGFESAIELGLLSRGLAYPFSVEVGGVGNRNTVFFRIQLEPDSELTFERVFVDRYSQVTSYFSIVGPDREEIPIDEVTGAVVLNGSTLLPEGEYFILAGGSEFKLPTRIEFLVEVGGGSPIWPALMPLQMTGLSTATWGSGTSPIWVDGDLQISLNQIEWFSGALNKLQVRPGTDYSIRINPAVGLLAPQDSFLTGQIYADRSNSSFFYSITADALPDANPSAFSSLINREINGYATSTNLFVPTGFNVPANLWLSFYETSPNGGLWTPVAPSPDSDVQVQINGGAWISIRNLSAPDNSVVIGVGDVLGIRHIQKSTFLQFTRSIISIGRAEDFALYSFTTQSQPSMEVPAGSVVYWANPSTIPERWLILNGQSFSLVNFPMLAPLFPNGILPDVRGSHFRWNSNSNLRTLVESTSGNPSNILATNVNVVVESSVVSASSDATRQSATSGLHTHTFNPGGRQTNLTASTGILHLSSGSGFTGAVGHLSTSSFLDADSVAWGPTGGSQHTHGYGLVAFEQNPDHSHLVSVATNLNHGHNPTASVTGEIAIDNGAETRVRSFRLIPIIYGGLPPT